MDQQSDEIEEQEKFVLVPSDKLSEVALSGLVNEFILREGTDYGHSEVTLDDKKQRIYKQLETGKVKIVYSSLTESCTMIKATELSKLIDSEWT